MHLFQSTPFARRETTVKQIAEEFKQFQSTPFARRETIDGFPAITFWMFQSTPFARRGTQSSRCSTLLSLVSIHSLRKKGDAIIK